MMLATSLLVCAVLADSDEAKSPGEAVRERARRDAESFMPQRGLGGDGEGKLSPSGFEVVDVAIGMEGYEKMACHLSVPQGLLPGARCPLLYLVHGNGQVAKQMAEQFAAITTERDPVFCLTVQYQMLKEDGTGWPNGPWLGTLKMMEDGSRWILDHVLKTYPIDPERVFLGTLGWGARWSSDWLVKDWRERPGEFPFRACFFYSAAGFFRSDTVPPVPFVCTVGDQATEVKSLGGVNMLENTKRFANRLLSWGVPCHYHQFPELGHEVDGRSLQITRDTINGLGGPGAVAYGNDPVSKRFQPEPIPFKLSSSDFVNEVRLMLLDDRWKEGRSRAAELISDKSLDTKQKRPIRKLASDMDRFARKELGRLDKLLEKAIRGGNQLSPYLLRRMRAVVEAYPEMGWATKPGYVEKIEKLHAEYPPLVREKERAEIMRKAWALEADPEKREEAERLYEDLVLRAKEDEGFSIWPGAASYRLSWWIALAK
jgi:hypothetical protein